MAINPIDYGIALTPLNPAQQIMQGMQVGGGLLDLREQGLQRQQAADMRPLQMQSAQIGLQGQQLGLRNGLAAEADANAQRSLQEAMMQSQAIRAAEAQAAKQRLATGKLGADDFARFGVMYPEEAAKMKDVVANLSAEQKRQYDSDAAQVFAGLQAGNKAEVQDYLAKRIEATGKSGMDTTALENLSKAVETNDNAAFNMVGGYLSVSNKDFAKSMTETKVMDSTVKTAEAQASVALETAMADLGYKNAQTKRLASQTAIEWSRLGLDKAALAESVAARIAAAKREDTLLSEKQQDMLANSAVAASTSAELAKKAGTAAAAFENAQQSFTETRANTGIPARIGEAVNSAQGVNGTMTQSRLDYAQLVDADIMKNAAAAGNKLTNEDYANQRALYPSPTGDFVPIAKWLRDSERTNQKSAAINDAKAAWLGSNGNLGPAQKSFMVGDVVVGRGQTFQDVVKQIDEVAKPPEPASRRSGRGGRIDFTKPMGGT